LELFLIKHHAMKKYEGPEVWLHAFFTLTFDRDELSLHASAALALGKEPPVNTIQEAERNPELMWKPWRREKALWVPGI
jgi:hypothetical protein